jgi:hypothetical protein
VSANHFPASALKQKLLKDAGINDRARKLTFTGNQVLVPLKFDEQGNPASADRLVFKRLSLDDLRFLKEWRSANWDTDRASQKCGVDKADAEKLIRKLAHFRQEDARIKALCEIPTPDWIAAKHVENIYDGGTLQDSQQKSLAELAKIEGAYKQTAPQTQINVFNLPALPPEKEAELKRVFDTIAEESHVA